MVDEQYALYLVYLGIVVCFASWAEIACWMQTGERQAARIRVRYLQAMLKQDVSFFDTDARTGAIVASISSDTLMIQDAISEKVPTSPPLLLVLFIHLLKFMQQSTMVSTLMNPVKWPLVMSQIT